MRSCLRRAVWLGLKAQVGAAEDAEIRVPKPCVAGSIPAGATHLSPGETAPDLLVNQVRGRLT